MAQEFNGGDFWLPSEFLTDDDFKAKANHDSSYSFGFKSHLSSPVESVIGSAETESENDDLFTFLTMNNIPPHSNIQHTKSKSSSDDAAAPKEWKFSGSPQCTLRVVGCGSSMASFPPEMKNLHARHLLYAAAEEVARSRNIENKALFYPTQAFTPPLKSAPVSAAPAHNTGWDSRYYTSQKMQALYAYRRLQAKQTTTNGVWGLEKSANQFQNGGGACEKSRALPASALPTMRQSQNQFPASGTRAVFLGDNVAKKERSGTGVFLPRRYGPNLNETRKKTGGCSPVFLPDRVIHALNLNLDSIDAKVYPQSRNSSNIFTPEYDAVLKQMNSIMLTEQKRNRKQQSLVNQEFRLPQEWTY